MKPRDTVELALRNLRQARLRTFLTTLGVSIGIASLAGMVSLGIGLQEQFVGRFRQSGMFDTITVFSAGDRPGGFARASGAMAPRRGPLVVLDDAALLKFGAIERGDLASNLHNQSKRFRA
jgi:ABC-type antimicrobial peptide transport system permease subunit